MLKFVSQDQARDGQLFVKQFVVEQENPPDVGFVNQYRSLTASFRGRVFLDEPMARHTTYRIGGPADLLLEPEGEEDLRAALRFIRDYGVFGLILGKGSNLLVSDQGVSGVVIRLNRFCRDTVFDGSKVRIGAAMTLDKMLDRVGEESLGGIEFLSGIPGTLGGAVRGNAGAYGGEIGQRVTGVEVMDRNGEVQWLSEKEVSFHYRGVDGIEPGSVVLSAWLSLDKVAPENASEERNRVRALRRESQPLSQPSCGSVFKRTPGAAPPGELIEKAGCKGLRRGGAEVSRKHANFIVNHGKATAADVWSLIHEVRRRVWERFEVPLALEVQPIGEFEGQ